MIVISIRIMVIIVIRIRIIVVMTILDSRGRKLGEGVGFSVEGFRV